MTVRKQVYSSSFGRKKILFTVIVASAVILLAVMFAVRFFPSYSPPKWEAGAVEGKPAPDEGYLYDKITSDYGYSFYMAANLYRQEDGSVNIFLTNPEDDEVNIMCEIRDLKTDELYYKSGLIKPGEYVEKLSPKTDFENIHHNVKVKVYAMEPDTYLSSGTTELNLSLQPW